MKLLHLQIDGFRGATRPLTIDFEPGKAITMIYGENGNGKSSISDALVCLCTSRVGTLDDRSSTDKKYLRAIGKAPSDVSIRLTTDAGVFTATCNPSGTGFNKTPESGFPCVRHIRRKPITELIDAEPTKRYDVLKSYIDVSPIFKSEEELRKLVRVETANLNTIRGIVKNTTEQLTKTWQDEGMPARDWRTWAEAEHKTDVAATQQKQQTIGAGMSAWQQVQTDFERRKGAHNALKTVAAAKETAAKALADFVAQNPEQNKVVFNVLSAASSYFKSEPEALACPVCRQPVIAEALREDIDKVLLLMQAFNRLSQEADNTAKQEAQQQRSAGEAMSLLLTSIGNFCRQAIAIKKAAGVDDWDSMQGFLDADEDVRISYLRDHYNSYQAYATELSRENAQLSATLGRHTTISNAFGNLISNEGRLAAQEMLVQRAEAALQIAEQLRKDFVTAELDAITSTVSQLYGRIHHQEAQYTGLSVSLDTGTKHSIDIRANFHNEVSISPQSVFSESHLDTLGMCILLALAKRYANDHTILVLDDVVMSVDEKHLQRFIDMLHTDLTEFAHIIVTTHYRPWREMYRHHRAPGGQVQFLDLRPWSLQHGIRLNNGKVDLTELREAMDADEFNRRDVAALSGVILENIFDFLAVLYQCKVPRKPKGDYVLRELVDCISAKFAAKLRVQHLQKGEDGKYSEALPPREVALAPIIERIKGLAIIRNWVGAHFNANADGVTDDEVRELGEATLELGALLTCPEHGNFPDRDKTGSYHETRSGSIRLHPLVNVT